jgi:hypothetical protein
MSQQKRLEPVTTPAPIVHRVTARAAQIADRFIGGLGNVDFAQFPGPQKPGQLPRITLVGLEPVADASGRERRRHHRAFHSELAQTPGNPKPARTRLVTGPHYHIRPVAFAQPAKQLFQCMQIIAERAQIVHRAVAAPLGQRDYNPFFIDI